MQFETRDGGLKIIANVGTNRAGANYYDVFG
jgi:hypothetical protein